TDEKPTKVVKVAVTGSSIKGVAAQSASPITVVKVDEILKQGVTTTEEALAKISANQSSFVTAQNVGASGTVGSAADLRGIGANLGGCLRSNIVFFFHRGLDPFLLSLAI
ncbi:hypothetical protein, partial [Acinetobacter baumannii]|uniref:hypothetical protein n=1 Tax=Acinetobacter baumannii TaxID=470 RepID=UPI000A5A0A89